MPTIDLLGGSYNGRSTVLDSRECVNLYPEIAIPGAKSPACLVGTPGLSLFAANTANGASRGLYTTSGGRLFHVVGVTVSEIGPNGTVSNVGAILTSSGPVHMRDNGNQLMITDGQYGYILNLLTNTFSQITDSDYPGDTSHVVFSNGFFVVNRSSTYQANIWISASYDGTQWDALDYASAEGLPDKVIAITNTSNELWIFGDKSSEVWFYSGNADFPFERVRGAFNNIGASAVHSVSNNGENVFWLGGNAQGQGAVWMAAGYQPQRISTHAIEYIIGQLSRIDDAVGYCYQQEGHAFYVLTFPSGNRTIVYDLTTREWHERAAINSASGQLDRDRAEYHAFWNGKNYVADYADGNVYELDLGTYKHNGAYIPRIKTSGHLHFDRKRVFFNSFEMDFEKGQGLVTGQGSEPEAVLQWSDDGGFTWSNEYYTSIGAIGQYTVRAKWNRLGSSRDRVFRVKITDPVKTVILGASADMEVEA